MKKPELTGGESPAFQSQPCGGSIAAENELLAPLNPFSRGCKACLAVLTLVCLFGSAAYALQLRKGLAVTAMTDYFSWGIYIINFVFFIGISMDGSFISAILRLLGAEWRHPITRMAEGITVFALLVAGVMIIADMGRPDRFLFVLRYGRLQSPILWDVLSLTTYLAGSLLFLYLPMVPDLAILRDRGDRFAPWRRWLYTKLALGWTGAPEQHRRLERVITVMSIIIIPVAVSIHTVTAWLFGMTLRPGWHSTIIRPDFVMGALYSGVAGVITTMAILRRVFHLERFLKPEHFKRLGYLLLALCVAYAYFVVNEHIGASYTKEKTEAELLQAIFHGAYAVQFWTTATNKPVEGATVTFSVPRLFGNLLLGEDKTLDDGTAAAPFPIGLPGDAEGRFRVIVEVKAPERFAGSRAERLLDGGLPFKPEREPFPRALWAPRAPVGLIVTILALMGF